MTSALQTMLQSVLGPDAFANATTNGTSASMGPLLAALPSSLRHLASGPMIMSGAAGTNGLLFFLMGSMFETVRFLFSSAFDALKQAILAGWYSLVKAFIFQVRVEKDDEAFDWLMNFFGKEPAFKKATSVCLSTKVSHKHHNYYAENCGCEDCTAKSQKLPPKDLTSRLSYVPANGDKGGFTFLYGYSRINVTRGDHWHDGLNINIFTFGLTSGRATMTKLVTAAKTLQEQKASKRISVYLGQPSGAWTRAESKARRAWSSVILEHGVKERLLRDATEFLRSQEYYAERGIPYRRGYLLHGVPGSGKTSLVQALAGLLDLDIYVIPLANRGFDDGNLGGLIAGLPVSCLALIEDIDCAFNDQARNRFQVKKSSQEQAPNSRDSSGSQQDGGVTLSGLLNAIDGVAAHEGRLLFATTNVPSMLDPALIRPGRIDLSVEFKNASQSQAEQLFKCFFPADRTYGAYEGDSEEEHDTEQIKRPTLSVIVPDTLTPPGTPNSERAVSSDIEKEEDQHLTVEERDRLAKEFARDIPEREFSMASLQGYLLIYKEAPHKCARHVAEWVKEQRNAQIEAKAKEDEAEKESNSETKTTKDGDEAGGPSTAGSKAGPDSSDLWTELQKLRTATEEMQKALKDLQSVVTEKVQSTAVEGLVR